MGWGQGSGRGGKCEGFHGGEVLGVTKPQGGRSGSETGTVWGGSRWALGLNTGSRGHCSITLCWGSQRERRECTRA